MQHGRINTFLATGNRFLDLPRLTINRLVQRQFAIAQFLDDLFSTGFGRGTGVLLDQLRTNARGHSLQRQLLRLAVLLDAQYHYGLRVQLQRRTVSTFIHHFGAECSLNYRAIGGNTVAAFTTKWRRGMHGQLELLSRLSQIGRFKRRVFQLLGRIDKQAFNLLGFQVMGQLVFQAGKARHFRCFNAQQLDQVITEAGAHRLRHLVLLQPINRRFEHRVVNTRACEAQVTAIGSRARILGEFLGQSFEAFAFGQALLNLGDLGLGLLVADLVIHFDQDMRSPALFGQVGDFLLIQGLQLVILHGYLVKESGLLQLDIVDHHLIRGHEFFGVLVVVSLDLGVAQFHRSRVGLDVQRSEITGLFFQTGKRIHLLIGHETTARQTGTQLTNQHFLAQHVTELQATVTQLTDHLVETLRAELAVFLKFRGQQNDLVQRGFRERKFRVFGALQQQLAIDQPFEGRFTQHFFIQQRRVEVLAQLLQQLTTLHVDGLAQFNLGDFFTVDLGSILAGRGGLKNGIETGQRH